MSNWVDLPDGGHRCTKHNVSCAIGEVCRQCASERRSSPVAQVDGTALAESIAIDTEILTLADDATAYAKYLYKVSRERIEDGNPNDWGAAAKLIAEATKLQRFAVEQKHTLSSRAHSRHLVEHEKQIKGLHRKGN